MLIAPENHEWLEVDEWDDGLARETVRAIAAQTVAALGPDGRWPVHPGDREEGELDGSFAGIYLGSAGIEWGLRALGDTAGVTDLTAGYLASPDFGERGDGLWFGEAGVLLVDWLGAGDAGVADRLLECVCANTTHPSNEVMWGAPGTMLAAEVVHATTRDARFAAAWREGADRLWGAWVAMPEHGCHLWTIRIYGYVEPMLGAGHGFASNVRILWRGRRLLDPERVTELERRAVAAATTLAIRDGELANWPPVPGESCSRLQWCHGAPGMITSLAELGCDDADFTRLLCAGGDLVWRAGPLAKGHGLCHGTAGNGYALLALHRRTGDDLWLERARVFAMQAMAQCRRTWDTDGYGRHSLFTGDLGLALYLRGCLDADAGFPTIDRF